MLVKFKGAWIDVRVSGDDDFTWWVAGFGSSISLLDQLLHENHDDEVIELIIKKIDENKQDKEL